MHYLLSHVDPSGLYHELLELWRDIELFSKLRRGFINEIDPISQRRALLQLRIGIGIRIAFVFLELAPSARLRAVEELLHQTPPVCDGASQTSFVDEVEMVFRWVCPV